MLSEAFCSLVVLVRHLAPEVSWLECGEALTRVIDQDVLHLIPILWSWVAIRWRITRGIYYNSWCHLFDAEVLLRNV